MSAQPLRPGPDASQGTDPSGLFPDESPSAASAKLADAVFAYYCQLLERRQFIQVVDMDKTTPSGLAAKPAIAYIPVDLVQALVLDYQRALLSEGAQ